jgi:hypothetical protein
MVFTLVVCHPLIPQAARQLGLTPYLLEQKHFRNFYGGAVMSNCRIFGTRNGQSPNGTSGAEMPARTAAHHEWTLHTISGSTGRGAAFLGLPPSFPFALEAAFLALLLDWPPI